MSKQVTETERQRGDLETAESRSSSYGSIVSDPRDTEGIAGELASSSLLVKPW